MRLRLFLATLSLGIGLLVAARYLGTPQTSSAEPPSAGVPQLDGSVLGRANALAALRASPEEASADTPPAVAWSAEVLPSAANVSQGVSMSRASPQRLTGLKPDGEDASRAMTRDIQSELIRLGCFRGQTDGRWTPALQQALGDFNTRLNARLPIDGPDYAVLNYARNQPGPVCGASAVTPNQQDALVPGSPVPFDGRMSLGATTASPAAAPEAASTAKPAPRRTSRRVESLFLHPLGRM